MPLSPAPASDETTLDALVEEARNSNPDILAARKRWEASLSRVPLSRALEGPSIGVTVEKIPRGTLKLDRTMPEDRMLSFSQFLPFFGKLPLRKKIAVVEAQIAAAEYRGKELDIANQVKQAYFGLYMNRKEAGLTRESLALLESIARIAETNYALGDASQQEVYKIHAEVASLAARLSNLELEHTAKQARLISLLNSAPDREFGIFGLDETAAFAPDTAELYQAALANQPELHIFTSAIEKNKYAVSLAKKGYFPDLMATIVQRGIASGGIGPWDLMLSFTVPFWFWTKQRYEVREAIASVEEAEAALQAMENKAYSEIAGLTAGIASAKNRIRLYTTTLIPMLESSIASGRAALSSGKGDFMLLLDSQRMLIDAKMQYYQALVDYHAGVADLERAAGVALPQETEVEP